MSETNRRSAGVLLHLTSLPGPHGSGDLGQGARDFADFLAEAGMTVWQMLPVTPVGAGYSPYSGRSAFAGNPLLVDLEALAARGLVDRAMLPPQPEGRVDYPAVMELRDRALRAATTRSLERDDVSSEEREAFRERARGWLDDYTLFMALSERHGGTSWTGWPEAIARRAPEALDEARRELKDAIAHHERVQFFFDEQWRAFRSHCRSKGIRLVGDVPIFVAHDSADVWANQELFRLGATGEPTHVAGVPPDYFSKTGQRWGNPHYRWKHMKRDGYAWWRSRFESLLSRFDEVRLDHFIGFLRYWEIEASQPTAEHGRYVKGPGAALFEEVERRLGHVSFIAEDLGAVTPAVRRPRKQFRLPGMRVLQFAFGTDVQAEMFRPHAFVRRTVAYTGTHDNDTFVGWLDDPGGTPGNPRTREQAAAERRAASLYLTGEPAAPSAAIAREAIRSLHASVADTVVVPMQDLLGLGNEARMNVPGSADDNWSWRLDAGALVPQLAARLHAQATIYGRLGSDRSVDGSPPAMPSKRE